MLISLYTSRIVLNALGESDYGVYSVVGGLVVIFSFLNSALSSSTQRFLNVALCSNDRNKILNVFNTSLQIHITISIIILILAETVGLWFFNNYLNIPLQSRHSAFWVYQFSIFSTILGILSAPYNAALISHERMSVFAYFSLIEGGLKLIAAFTLLYINRERLILYAAMICVISLLTRCLYNYYCVRHFDECKGVIFSFDRKLLKKMSSFSGWSLFSSIGFVASTQGIAVIVNIFFGTILNAALSIANQVNAAIYQLIYGFLQAIKPQIMKSYAMGDLNRMRVLILRGSKMALLLTGLGVFPISLEINTILKLWLEIVPEYTAVFVVIMLVTALVNASLLVFVTAQEATGNIKHFQLITLIVSLLYLPLAWLVFRVGFPPYYALLVNLVLACIAQTIRLIFIRNSVSLSIRKFISTVIFPFISCSCISLIIPMCMKFALTPSTSHSILNILTSLVAYIISAFYVGLNSKERLLMSCYFKQKILRR